MPIENAIAEYRFAYSQESKSTQMNPPPASLSMNALSPQILLLFERAFVQRGIRPSAKEWILALEELSSSLKSCQKNRGHYHLNSLGACPWCDIELKSNSTLFPIIFSSAIGNQSFHSLWQQVIGIKDPGSILQPSDINTRVLPPPDKTAKELGEKVKKLDRSSFFFFSGAVAVALIIGGHIGYSLWQLIPTGVGLWGFIQCKNKKSNLIAPITRQFADVKTQWKELSSNWISWSSNAAFLDVRQPLEELKKKHDALQQDRQDQLQRLWDNRRYQQFMAHLDGYQIADAEILGVGFGRKATLQSYGIETAADIAKYKIEIGGFGPKLIQRLVDWKERCGRSFKFDSVKGISQLDMQLIDRDLLDKRHKLEQELSIGLVRLKRISDQIQDRRRHLYSVSSKMRSNYLQIAANAQEVGIEL